MPLQVTATIILTACCAVLAFFSFYRLRDAGLALALAVLVFIAFVAGSVSRPVTLAPKRISLESMVAKHVGANDRSRPTLDQESLDDLPNIPVPALGQIDFVGVRDSNAVSAASAHLAHPNQYVELRGSLEDPLAHAPASGLFLIVNSTRRINVSLGYGGGGTEAPPSRDPRRGADFIVELPASQLPEGNNKIQLAGVATDQRGFFKLPDRVTVTVTER